MSLPQPFDIEDTGSFGAEMPGTGKAGTFYQSGHDLPNGLRISFMVGHIDRMPRCGVTGLATPFCRHCDDVSHTFHTQENACV